MGEITKKVDKKGGNRKLKVCCGEEEEQCAQLNYNFTSFYFIS